MYKILLAGAVVSTLMVMQAKAEDKKVSNENASKTAETKPQAPTIENDHLKAVFEQSKKDFTASEKSTSIVKTGVPTLPLVPQEKDIENFPTPLAATDQDPQHIASYYEAVADAYAAESERIHDAMVRSHHASDKHKVEHQIKDIRHQDRHLPYDDINQHKEGHSRDNSTVPYRSARYTPHNVHKDNHVLQNKRYNELKQEYDRLVMKHDFYEDMADFAEKKVAATKQQNDTQLKS